jgi:hypothetical protein
MTRAQTGLQPQVVTVHGGSKRLLVLPKQSKFLPGNRYRDPP